MAIYEIIVDECGDLTKTIAVIRNYSALSITDIRKGIKNHSPIISIESSVIHPEMDHHEGYAYEHNRFLEAVTQLQNLNVKLKFQYRASVDWNAEQGGIEMIKNLMESERQI